MTRVLVVEDDAIISTDIAETLIRLGYEVPATADDCDTALREAAACAPDIVLMDIHLRGSVDGIETVLRLRRVSDVPVVYLTAHTDEATLARAKETGPHGYLVKPFNERDLRTAIEVAVRKHQLERRLAERERWFSTTLASLGDAVIATDPEQRITFMNPVASAITGVSMEAAKNRPLGEVLRLVDERGAALKSPLEQALKGHFTVRLAPNSELVDQRGNRHMVDDSASPIVDERGAVLGGVIVFRDITERKRLEQRLEVAERLAALGSMASGMAHELNNPLTAVIGNVGFAQQRLDVIARRAAPGQSIAKELEECAAALQDAASGADRLRKIIDTMRSFVSRGATKGEICDIPELLESALKLTHDAVTRKARLVRSLGTTPFVNVDEARFVQVFVNLLTNAADAIPAGHAREHEVAITTRTDAAGRAVVEVRDSGVGIRPTDLGRIFDPFFTTKAVGSGMGLGLALSHVFVTSAGGEIAVESQLGHGTTFRVSLPPATAERAPAATAAPSVEPRRGRVLVLDDEPTITSIIKRLLSDHDVTTESDGHAVLSRIANGETFDVVFCDLMMPGMSGVDVYQAVDSANPTQASKFVFLTGGVFSPHVTEFLERSKNMVITKPFAVASLRAAITELTK